MRLVVIVLLAAALAALPAAASDYVFRDGYYWFGSRAYTRTQHYNPGYWSYGCYYPASYSYAYSEVSVAAPAATPAYTDANWRSKLLDIAGQRDRYEGEVRKGAFEQAYFMQSVKALGLEGNFQWQGYGAAPPYGQGYGSTPAYALGNGSYPAANFGANASTGYGYTYSSIAQLYGDANLNQLYQQAAQLAAQSQKIGGDATANFSTLVGTEGGNRARVAEILARGQMAQQVIAALAVPNSATVQTRGFSFKIGADGSMQRQEDPAVVTPEIKAGLRSKFDALATERCASCHSGGTKKGGFDIAEYAAMDQGHKERVWTRLTTDDAKLLMPRLPDGSAGKKLTADELRLFVTN